MAFSAATAMQPPRSVCWVSSLAECQLRPVEDWAMVADDLAIFKVVSLRSRNTPTCEHVQLCPGAVVGWFMISLPEAWSIDAAPMASKLLWLDSGRRNGGSFRKERRTTWNRVS